MVLYNCKIIVILNNKVSKKIMIFQEDTQNHKLNFGISF